MILFIQIFIFHGKRMVLNSAQTLDNSSYLLEGNTQSSKPVTELAINKTRNHFNGIMNSTTLLDKTENENTIFLEYSLGIITEKYGEILAIIKLSGGLTNSVYKITTINGGFVLKIGNELKREKEFFTNTEGTENIPKMYDFFEFDGKQGILMEYKSGMNGKQVVNKIQNWSEIGRQMGSTLKQIHSRPYQNTDENKAQSITSIKDYLSWGNEKSDLEKLEKFLQAHDLDIVTLHGDFSPHNCLFGEILDGRFQLATVFDPSGRIEKGPAIFDIYYALNNRWILDKKSFEEGFLIGYFKGSENIDFKSEGYLLLSKVFNKYLATLYDYLDSQNM